MANLLQSVREGMKVYDSSGAEIGAVEYVKLSDENPATPEAETVTASGQTGAGRTTLFDAVADAFRADDLPETLQGRLLRNGFLRMDAAGLFKADRYILPEQIASVTADGVRLNVSRDQLISRT